MALYKLTADVNTVIRTSDNASIPNNPKNADWVEYQRWLTLGTPPDPYVEDTNYTAYKARIAAFQGDANRADLLTQLKTATPAQINSYIDNNVTDLASARAMLKKIVLVLSTII